MINSISQQWLQWFDTARSIHFVHPLWFVALITLMPITWLWRRLRRALPATAIRGSSLRTVAWPRTVCAIFLLAAGSAFVAALARPERAQLTYQESCQVCMFQILIDDSGSMFTWDIDDAALSRLVLAWERELYVKQMEERKKYPALYPKPPKAPDAVPTGNEGKLERFSLARYAAWQFVRSRMRIHHPAAPGQNAGYVEERHEHGDEVGIGVFDDTVYRAYPLTDNLDIIIDEIEELKNAARNGGGTNFDGPRPDDNYFNLGAFQYTINQFKAVKKEVKTKVMIFISDGEDGISEKRHEELVQQMLSMNIHVYLLCCGPQANLSNSATASVRKLIQAVNPHDPAHPEFQEAVIWAGDGAKMSEAFATIDRLEKTTVQGQSITTYHSIQHEFVVAGCLLGALFVLACALLRLEL